MREYIDSTIYRILDNVCKIWHNHCQAEYPNLIEPEQLFHKMLKYKHYEQYKRCCCCNCYNVKKLRMLMPFAL